MNLMGLNEVYKGGGIELLKKAQSVEKVGNMSEIDKPLAKLIKVTDDGSGGKLDKTEPNDSKEEKKKDMSDDEINKKQREEIKNGLKRIFKGEKLSNKEKGNLCEMMMDQYYISQGYKPLNKDRITGLEDEGHQGIDGVYEKTNPDGTKSYKIADAKYGSSPLGDTDDGKQMSDNWIDKRLDEAVGKEKADEIRESYENDPNSVTHEIYHLNSDINENGKITSDIQDVDSDGNKVGEKTVVEEHDNNGRSSEVQGETK